MKKTLTLLLGLLLVVAIGRASDFTDVKQTFKTELSKVVPSFENVTAVKANVFEELNTYREDLGLDKFTYNITLDQQAQNWVYQLSEDNVTHDLRRSTGQFKGEVILMYEGELRPERILGEFLNSPQHKQIILNSNYRQAGIGIKRTSGANFVVIRFI